MENQKSKFQHVCEVDRQKIYGVHESGFKCQFEGLYRDIREKHYDDFYNDFYEYKGKYYCPFHAPMEAKKIMGKQINMTKEDLLGIFYDTETIPRKSYLNKFNNTIYGIINNQIKSFSARIEKDDYESKNEQRITLYGVVFPIDLSLTKHGEHCCAEHKNYIDCKDSFIPFLDFGECEINGNLEIEAGPQNEMTNFFTKEISQEIYPQIYIDGASFCNSTFKNSIYITGVDFANKKLKNLFGGVNFDNSKFQCRSINFDNSIFETFSLKNSQIFSYNISFKNILVHHNFDISCNDDASDETKRIKSHNGINFFGAQFGDKNTYNKLTKHGEDIGGEMICENRIFDCNVSFNLCSFYQTPNFYNTKFNKNVSFEYANFFQSCYKQHYYNYFRSIRFEMARKNLYREESRFWRLEEKCLEKKTIFIPNLPKFFIYKKIISVFKFFSKKARKEKYDTFTISQGFIERWLSKLFDMACERGTSFAGILLSIIFFPLLIFPILYFCGAVIYECLINGFMVDYLSFIKICFKESFARSMLYTFDPFYKSENPITRVSFELVFSYFQSIIQITLYVIFGFMLKRRFRISN